MRLSQNHRPGPRTADHVGQIPAFLFRGARQLERMDGAMREHGAEFECKVGRGPQLLHGRVQHLRHGLSAVFSFCTELRPAARDKLQISVTEARCSDDTIRCPCRAMLIAGLIQRFEHVLCKTRGLLQDGIGKIAGIVGKLGTGDESGGA